MPDSPQLLVASSNSGKLREYRELAAAAGPAARLALDPLPRFDALPAFEESAPTFGENAAGKALHYSRFADLPVLADDSGLTVYALGGRPGVHSARYAGPNATAADRVAKLLGELAAARIQDLRDRRARFVCVLALARRGRIICVLSDSVEGEILDAQRGSGGFGYDPVFLYPPLGKTFSEIGDEQKNLYSHRGRAFRKLLEFLAASPVL